MCAEYSDFLCIWLRKCDFLTEKLGIGRIRIRNDLFRIRIRILQKVPGPAGSGSRSTTLLLSRSNQCDVTRVADPDPDWIRIQSGQWIRILNPDPDPGGQKLPTKVDFFLKVHVLKCWMASLES
jgi:hypothetical protein